VRWIEEWLGDVGLGEYASRFVENNIHLSIVRDLSDQDLKEPGVASPGHRRKLLRAISELNASPAEKPRLRPTRLSSGAGGRCCIAASRDFA
jgi:SAM domain (Sterile alpha motif)